jgi:Ca-activated chloride channel family protein
VLALWVAAPAAGQEDPEASPGAPDRSVLIILDGSDSMNEPAGDGGTRLDAAKAALGGLIDVIPEGARVGLRVYGSELSGVSRAQGCRDTKLVSPVGPLDREGLRGQVEALEGKGRTPIGRSLVEAPDDLGPSGDRTVILISDGGDNCAPPPPCEAAERVAERGVELSISVVGLQVNERVRRQLECIADAGGGTYVDAGDPEALRRELLAAFARAFRGYEPAGTPVEGSTDRAAAPVIGEGQYLDGLRPGQEGFYAVDVKPGQKLYVSQTAIPPRGIDGSGVFVSRLITPQGEELDDQRDVIDYDFLGQYGNIVGLATRSEQTAAPGVESELQPGRWRVGIAIETGDLEPREIPVELGVQVLDPNEDPGLAREPGRPGVPPGPGAPEPQATPSRTPAPGGDEDEGGGAGASLALAGGGGLLAGLLGGFAAMRRRRA